MSNRLFCGFLAVALLMPMSSAFSQEIDDTDLPGRDGHTPCLVTTLHTYSKPELKELKIYHVLPDPGTEGSAHNLIADTLLGRGFSVTVGELEEAPDDVEVMVHSRSDWVWDFTTYLRALVIMFRTPDTNELIGVSSFDTSDHSSSRTPEYVRGTVSRLLSLLARPERAIAC